MIRRIFILLLFLPLLLMAWNPLPKANATVKSAPTLTPLVIDTDMGLDDWLAILYLLQRPHVQVQAITVTGTGLAHCEAAVQNALNLIALVTPKKIPVSCGRTTPLVGTHAFPESWRIDVDRLFGIPLKKSPVAADPRPADRLLASMLTAAPPQKIHLIALGPLTNIAQALQSDPQLAQYISKITLMGGAVRVGGNLMAPGSPVQENRVSEWNLYIDPLASEIVWRSGVPLELVPLDCTNLMPMTTEFTQRLQQNQRTAAAKFVHQALEKIQGDIAQKIYFFWDPLAAVLATENSDLKLAQFKTEPIKMVSQEGPHSGQTQLVTTQSAGHTLVQVCQSIEQSKIEELFLKRLNGLK